MPSGSDVTPREIKVMAPTGQLGAGFSIDSLQRGMAWGPDVIGCDAGTVDGGPYYLGADDFFFSHEAMRRDLRELLCAARETATPLIVGSAATGGTNRQLDAIVDMAVEIAEQEGLKFRLGVIRSEPSRDVLKKRFREGAVTPLANAPQIDESVFDRSSRIVAVAGVEPFQLALDEGADVIIAGRSSDVSIFAALPLSQGFAPGPVYGAAKILECGAAPVETRKHSDPLFAWIRDDHFIVAPPNPEYRCTPLSVASHNLYEAASPFELRQPGGTLYCDGAQYEAVDDRSVRVSGTRFEPTDVYTIKLEGAELIGYQSLVIGAIHDPIVLRQLDAWQAQMEASCRSRIADVWGKDVWNTATFTIRRYGCDAAMGAREPNPRPGHEIGLVLEITAESQNEATALIKSVIHMAVHSPVPEWSGLITTIAFPYSPHHLERGPTYRFTLNHVVAVEDPMELFEVELKNV